MSEHKEAIRKALIEQVKLGFVEITFDGRTDAENKLIPSGELDDDASKAIESLHKDYCAYRAIVVDVLDSLSADGGVVGALCGVGMPFEVLYKIKDRITEQTVANALEEFSCEELIDIWKMHPDYDHLESLAEQEIGPKDEGFYER